MLEFLKPIALFDVWLYIGLGFIALFLIRIMWLARIERIRSIFTLERENASDRMVQAFIALMIVFSLMMGVHYLSSAIPRIAPSLPDTPTPTPIFQLPPSPTPPAPLWIFPTPTTTPTPTETPSVLPTQPEILAKPTDSYVPPPATPASSLGQPVACSHSGATITKPTNGAHVNGIIEIQGAASTENFFYYKFEYRTNGQDWNFSQRYNLAVANGVLGMWNTDTVSPGLYEFRLVVVDTTGNYPAPCTIQLVVE